MLKDALVYPFQNRLWLSLVILGSAFLLILKILMLIPVLRWVAGGVMASCLAALYMDTIATTITQQDRPLKWPALEDIAHNLLEPAVKLLVVIVVSGLPLFLAYFLIERGSVLWTVATLTTAAYAFLYFPMASLAMVAAGNPIASLPHVVLPAMMRTLPHCLGASALLASQGMVAWCLEDALLSVPYAGEFLSGLFLLYGLLVQGRFIGLVYLRHSERIAWFE